MALPAGTRLGPYEILSPLGAGGMGEVYRARDTRLSREVAIKVLPESLASDQERLKRFEKEARSASALNHPNIVTIHDIGAESGVSYIAMELVDGTTLRELLASGALPIKRLLQIAPQIAEGLARAHEAGIVHRDLKPENVMVKKDGLVKILDFGLAKLSSTGSGSGEGSQLPTMTGTQPGVVVGTVSYMSPEQASGAPIDFRSDQFSFGSMLYEMATGKRAFQKKTAIDTLGAILNDEPQPIAAANPQTPTPLRWIAERCLAKEPRQRYASTEDLARDLAGVRDHISEVGSGSAAVVATRRSSLPRIAGAVGAAVLLAAGYFFATLRSHSTPLPSFQRVTFRQGAVWRARFAPDGQTIVYAMGSVGTDRKPGELFSTRVGSLDSRSLGLPPADILSISVSGQIAISLPEGLNFAPGTLAEASLAGGTARPILEHVWGADWSPDGKELAITHDVGGKHRIELPVGKVLYESANAVSSPRISPDGATVAFTEDNALRLTDRKGVVRTLVHTGVTDYVCWSPRGDELWWVETAELQGVVHAVTLKGRERVITTLPGEFILQDLSRDGRLLVERVQQVFSMSASFPGEAERSLAWLDQSAPAALSADRQMLLFADRGDTDGTNWATYIRKTDGAAAVRLGTGFPLAISPDGKWAIAVRDAPGPRLVLLPTGVGQERALSEGFPVVNGPDIWAAFHPDGKRIFFSGKEPGHRVRAYEQSLEGGAPTPVTPEGVRSSLLSPDGKFLAGLDEAGSLMIFAADPGAGNAARAVAKLADVERLVHWNADGRSVLVINDSARPIRIDRLDLSSGLRTPWRSLSPGTLLGAGGSNGIVFSTNEDAWVVGYNTYFSELLVVDGLK